MVLMKNFLLCVIDFNNLISKKYLYNIIKYSVKILKSLFWLFFKGLIKEFANMVFVVFINKYLLFTIFC